MLDEISARMARFEKFDPETTMELRQLRQNVKDVFNKGLQPGDEIIEQLYFLQPQTRDLVEKMSLNYGSVVTPDDFKQVAQIMSMHLGERVPILKDFTKFFGRLAEEYLSTAKPSKSNFDWTAISKTALLGQKKKGRALPDSVSKLLGIKPGEPFTEEMLKRYTNWKPNGTLSDILYGVDSPGSRRTGAKYLETEIAGLVKTSEVELFYAKKMPKSWTNVPWVNFDGKIIEQNFTQSFEERLRYKDKDGNWFTNIIQIKQKTESSWWEQVINKSGKINDIADATKARTAFGVNGNHSNDAVIVKKFHQWGKKEGISTSTIHDAFFANAADMLKARDALREIYAEVLEKNVILMTLNEMRARGLPKAVYKKYLDEAIESGLIPVIGRSKINGKLMTPEDILNIDDIKKEVPKNFKNDYGWYGVG